MGTPGWIAAAIAVLSLMALVGAAIAWLYRKVLKPLSLLVEDWAGEDGRPGVPRRPGVMERLASTDRAVEELVKSLREHATRLGILEERLSAIESRNQP